MALQDVQEENERAWKMDIEQQGEISRRHFPVTAMQDGKAMAALSGFDPEKRQTVNFPATTAMLL